MKPASGQMHPLASKLFEQRPVCNSGQMHPLAFKLFEQCPGCNKSLRFLFLCAKILLPCAYSESWYSFNAVLLTITGFAAPPWLTRPSAFVLA